MLLFIADASKKSPRERLYSYLRKVHKSYDKSRPPIEVSTIIIIDTPPIRPYFESSQSRKDQLKNE
jgi:hypothetical protein